MPFDPAGFLRLDALQSAGTSATGAAFATSTGDMLEVGSCGPGVIRLRVGPSTRPDYGLVAARAKACAVEKDAEGTWTFAAGETTFELTPEPLRFRLARSPTSTSAAPRACRRSAGCGRAGAGSRRSRFLRASRSTGWARNSARSTSADSSSIRTSRMRWA
jgi:hypothetical protein